MNKQEVPLRAPDHEWPAQIAKEAHILGSGICRIWTPRLLSERTILEFEYRAPGIGVVPPPFRVFTEQGSEQSGLSYFFAEGVWFNSIPQFRHSDTSGKALRTAGVSELLVIGRKPAVANVDSIPHQVTFRISDNPLLEPTRIIEQSPQAGISAETIRAVELESIMGHRFRFERHFDFAKSPSSDASQTTIVRSLLVATTEATIKEDLRAYVESSTLPALQEVLRLASFAGRADTRAFSWQAVNSHERIQAFLGNMTPMAPASDDEAELEPLIDKVDFQDFMAVCLKTLHGSETRRAKLSHLAVLKATSRKRETIESTYLRLFSALESILLLYREQENLKFICGSGAWKKLERALRQCADDHADLFASDFHFKAAKEAMPAIRRIAVGRVFEKFAAAYGVEYLGLWPVFDSPDEGIQTLASIRNQLIHGDLDIDHRLAAFGIALNHLEVLVVRCCLAILGWDWKKSEASESYLHQRTGFDKESLARAIAGMERPSV